MDLKQIEELMQAMGRCSVNRVALKREGFEIEVERAPQQAKVEAAPMPSSPPAPAPAAETPPLKEPVSDGDFITSPMVGTFYATPSPQDPPFVKVGDTVDEGSILCIVEAMKVMNEVKAGKRGRIMEIFLKSGDPVEFGTKICRIEAS